MSNVLKIHCSQMIENTPQTWRCKGCWFALSNKSATNSLIAPLKVLSDLTIWSRADQYMPVHGTVIVIMNSICRINLPAPTIWVKTWSERKSQRRSQAQFRMKQQFQLERSCNVVHTSANEVSPNVNWVSTVLHASPRKQKSRKINGTSPAFIEPWSANLDLPK